MSKRKKITVKKRQIRVFAILFDSAFMHMKLSKNAVNKRDERYFLISSIIHIVFAFESYLNHLGHLKLKTWDEIERKLNIKEKLVLLSELCDFELDFGSEPIQTVMKIKKYRDFFAHGKTQYLISQENYKPFDVNNIHKEGLLSDWEKFFTYENVEKANQATQKMMEYLMEKTDLEKIHPIVLGFESTESGYPKEE